MTCIPHMPKFHLHRGSLLVHIILDEQYMSPKSDYTEKGKNW